MSEGFVIRRQTKLRLNLFLVVIAAISFAVLYFIYNFGFEKGISQASDNIAQYEKLESQIVLLKQKNESLRDELIALKRGNQVERKAYKEVEKTLQQLEQERVDLREDLAFYNSILTDDELSGVRIRELKIHEMEAGKIMYELILTRDMKNGKVMKGSIELAIEGISEQGETVNLSLRDLSKETSLELKIKYLQRIEGVLSLPEMFKAKQVTIKIKPAGKSAKKVTKSFEWSALIG